MADCRHHENGFSIFPTAIQWNFVGRRKLYYWLDEKSKFPDPRCERAPYLKSFSRYISAPYCLGETWSDEAESHDGWHMSRDQYCKFRKFKMADGRQFQDEYNSISAANSPISMKSGVQMQGFIRSSFMWSAVGRVMSLTFHAQIACPWASISNFFPISGRDHGGMKYRKKVIVKHQL